MRWLQRFRMAMLMLFHRKSETARLNNELQFHLEQQIAENVGQGMDPEQARLAALRVFGNPTLLREESQSTWSWNWLEALWRDARYGIRTLGRSPEFFSYRHSCDGPGHRGHNVTVYGGPLGLAEAVAFP